jgi:myo-inositol-1-phosphate synthase
MMIGLGGNNGSTLTASLLAHKHKITWETKEGIHTPNFYGSFTQSATCRTGIRQFADGKIQDVYTPISKLIPMVNPVEIEVTGWDISKKNLFESCKRAQVLEPDLVNQLKE